MSMVEAAWADARVNPNKSWELSGLYAAKVTPLKNPTSSLLGTVRLSKHEEPSIEVPILSHLVQDNQENQIMIDRYLNDTPGTIIHSIGVKAYMSRVNLSVAGVIDISGAVKHFFDFFGVQRDRGKDNFQFISSGSHDNGQLTSADFYIYGVGGRWWDFVDFRGEEVADAMRYQQRVNSRSTVFQLEPINYRAWLEQSRVGKQVTTS